MGDWKILVPEATTNMVKNPSAEAEGNYTANAGTTVTRSTTYQYHGAYSYRVETSADNEGIQLTLATLTNAVHYMTFRMCGTSPDAIDCSVDNANFYSPSNLRQEGGWTTCGYSFLAAQCNGATTLYIQQKGAGAGDFYIDAVQVEAKAYETTYCDGDQPGCSWYSTPHGSKSTRAATTRAGGRERDLTTDYYLKIQEFDGVGMPPLNIQTQARSLLPGVNYQNTKTEARSFLLMSKLPATSAANLHLRRKNLLDVLKPDGVPGAQPFLLRYYGANVNKPMEIEAVLAEDAGKLDFWGVQKLGLVLMAPDPYFREIYNQYTALTPSASVANADEIVKRIDGTWSNISTDFGATVYGVAIGPNKEAWIVGLFTNVGSADGDYAVKYYEGAISALSTGLGGSGWRVAVAPDGHIYIGGEFTNLGSADGDYIIHWTGSAWSALGTGMQGGLVRGLAVGQDGTLYAAGEFTTAGGVANTVRVAKWNGTAWSAMGTGIAAGTAFCLAVGPDGSVYCGCDQTAIGGVTVNYIGKWNGSAWSALGSGTGGTVYSIAFDKAGNLYAGGNFTTAGGNTVNNIAKWNGSEWSALGSGMSGGFVYCVTVDDNGMVYAGGTFTSAGGITLADRLAVWNGSNWAHLDIDLPGSPIPYEIACDGDDLYVAYNTTGTALSSALTTVTNSGTATVYPKYVLTRSGGTAARLEYLKNYTTGKTLWFNYSLQDGETLTVDFAAKTIESSMFGNVIGRALLRNSDFADWSLIPGANTVALYVYETGTPTLTSYLTWRNTHWSVDGSAA